MFLVRILLLSIAIGISGISQANNTVKIHAPVEEYFSCTEHWDGQFQYLGDALGTDCVIQELQESDGRLFSKSYKNNGCHNEDWYGFGKSVLAPCDCRIVGIHVNEITNEPGKMIPGRASLIAFEMNDGTTVLIAHVANIDVQMGDTVLAGSHVATIGNNGYSRNPHLHIAGWKGKQALQIQFDQKTLALKSRRELNK